jgi:Undecaprenyl-phosphate galactose phosphotransferase WbaP
VQSINRVQTEHPYGEAREVDSSRVFGSFTGRRVEILKRWLINLVLISSDVALSLLVWALAALAQDVLGQGPLLRPMIPVIASSVLVWVVMRASLGLYPGYGLSQVEELRRQTYALLAAGAITTAFTVAIQAGPFVSRMLLFSGLTALLVLAPFARSLTTFLMMRAGLWGKPVLIMGSGEFGEQVVELLEREWRLGFRPVAVFSSHPASLPDKFVCLPGEKSLENAAALSRERDIDTIIIAMPHTRRERLAELVAWANRGFRNVTIIPNLEGVTNSAVVARDFAGVFGVELRHSLLDPSVRRVKRGLDVVFTLTGGAIILPVLAGLALLVWLESRGPVLYRAERMGRDNKIFWCLKFRTMLPDAEVALQRLLEENPHAREEYSHYHKLRDDPRVTPVGRLLRKASLDELPQLWNVLRGDMSLVGPRPYLPRESDRIGKKQSEILRVYPGITGPWQVDGRNRLSFDERVQIEADYVRNWSIWLDIIILVRTIPTLILDRSAH